MSRKAGVENGASSNEPEFIACPVKDVAFILLCSDGLLGNSAAAVKGELLKLCGGGKGAAEDDLKAAAVAGIKKAKEQARLLQLFSAGTADNMLLMYLSFK